jgi:PTS system nitrogen regulatory IIA component
MDIDEILSPENVLIDLAAASKRQLLQEMCSRAAEAVALPADLVCTGVLKREELGSTGTGKGVAIPHARFRELERPVAVFARLKRAIEFDAIDGAPVDVVFLLLLPALAEGDQLNTLAMVSRRLRTPDIIDKVRRAGNAAEMYRAMLTR